MRSTSNPSSQFNSKTPKNQPTRRRAKSGRSVLDTASALTSAIKPVFENLENRTMLSATPIYVYQAWKTLANGSPTSGATVTNSGGGGDSSITALYQSTAFNTVTQALTNHSAWPAGTNTIVVVAGNASQTYGNSEQADINVSNLTIEGWSVYKPADTTRVSTLDTATYTIDAPGVTVEGLTVEGAPTTGAFVTTANATGFSIKNNIFNSATDQNFLSVAVGGGSGAISNNAFTGDLTSVEISAGSVNLAGNSITTTSTVLVGTSHSPTTAIEVTGGSASISSGTISGPTTGVSVGTGAVATFTGGSIAASATGVEVGSGGSATVGSVTFTSNTTDLQVDSGASAVTATADSFSGTAYYIKNQSSLAINATTDSFSSADNFAIRNRIFDRIDSASSGLVTWVANNIYVTPIATSTSTDNDYTRLANAVGAASNSFTVNLQGTFDWTGSNALTAYTASKSNSSSDDISGVFLPDGVNNLTITAAVNAATIIGEGDYTANNDDGFINAQDGSSAVGNNSLTISNLTVDNFQAGIVLGWNGTGHFNGTNIQNNTINLAANNDSYVQSLGVYFWVGTNQQVSGNTINIEANGSGTLGTVGFQSGTSGGSSYDGLQIESNTINVKDVLSSSPQRIIGIWENGNGDSSNITVSGNHFNNLDAGNNPATNNEIAFRLTSPSSSTTAVIYSSNHVSGANVGFQYYPGYTNGGTQPVQFTANTLTNVANGFDFSNATSVDYLSGNSITGTGSTGVGINVADGSVLTTDAVSGANSLTGFATGILVSGAAASAAITGNDIAGNTTGIEFDTSAAGSVTGNDFVGADITPSAVANNGTDLLISSTAGAVTVGDSNKFAASTYYIQNLKSSTLDLSADTNTKFNGSVLGSLNPTNQTDLTTLYAIEDKIHDYLDNASLGYVSLNSTNVFVAATSESATSGAIQRGVNKAPINGTVNVQAGAFSLAAGLTISQQLTLNGAFSGTSGTDPSRGTNETILSGPADQNSPSTPGAFIINTTAAVTISGFTFNGSKVINGEPIASQLTFSDNVLNLHAMQAATATNIILNNPQNFTLTDNAFITTGENPSDSAVIQIVGAVDAHDNFVGPDDPVSITGNTFTGIANPLDGQSTLQLGVSNVQGNISGNTFNGVDIGVLVANHSGDLTLDSNTFENITRGASSISSGSYGAGIALYNPTFDQGTVTISNNTFQSSDTGIRTSTDGSGSFTLSDASLAITGNTFTSNVYDIVDKFAGTITPSNTNIFDGVTLSTAQAAASPNELYAVQDKILDGINVTGYGLVRTAPHSLYVTPTSETNPGAVARAESLASPTDTIHVEGTLAFTKTTPATNPYGITTPVSGTVGSSPFLLDGNSVTVAVTSPGPSESSAISSAAFSSTLDTSALNVGSYGLTYGLTDTRVVFDTTTGTTGTLQITPATLTISATTDSKTYDGTNTSSQTPSHSTLYNGDTLTVLTQAFESKDALGAGNSTLNVTNYVLSDPGNYTVDDSGTASGTITPESLTITATSDSKTYDGGTTSSQTPTVTTGTIYNGEVAFGQAFASKDALGTDASTLVVSDTVSAGGAGDYTITKVSATGTITPEALTITAAGDSKTYDGGTTSSQTPTVTTGTIYNGEVAFGQAFASKDALGAGNSVLVVSDTVSAGGAGDYTITKVSASGTITPESLTITATSDSKTYDGGTTSSQTPTVTTGTIYNSEVAFGQAFASKDALGAGNSVLVVSDTVSAGGAGDYTITKVSASGTITPESLTITATSDSKTYDGGTTSSQTPTVTTGTIYNGEVAFGQAFASKDALGAGNSVLVVSDTVSAGGAGDYTITKVSASGTITPESLTITATSDSKTYDGGTTSSQTPTVTTGTIYNSEVAFGQAFASKDALGAGNSVLVVSDTVSAGGAGDYTITKVSASGTITPESLTITATSDSKTYDGGTTSSQTPTVTTGTIYNGEVAFGQAFASKDALGAGNSVLVVSDTVSAGGAGDYTITKVSASGTITPESLTITATSDSKTYDGGTTSSQTPTVTTGTIYNGEVAFGQAFASKDALGAGNSVLVVSDTVSAGGAADYTITKVSASGTITPESLTITATSDSKTYDGGTTSSQTPTVTTGTIYNGEVAFGQAFASKDALGTDASTLVVSDTVSAGGAGDYTITKVSASGTITPESLTITATSDSKTYDGGTTSSQTPTVTTGTIYNGEVAFGQAFASKDALGAGNSVLVVSDTVSAGGAGDYTITKVSATGTITPEALTITAAGDSKTYDGGTTSSQTPTVTTGTIYNGEVAFGQAFASKDALGAGNSVLVVSDTVSAGGAGDYTITKVSASGTITPESLTITATSDSKTYDGGTTSSQTPTVTTGTIYNSEVAFGQAFASKDALGAGNSVLVVSDTVSAGGAGDYTITKVSASGTITPESLTITATSDSKTYDGGTTSSQTPTVTTGTIYNGEVAFGQAFASKDALGAGNSVLVVSDTVSAGGAGDYTITKVSASGTITPESLTITATSDSKTYDGGTTSSQTPTVTTGTIYNGEVAFGQAFASKDALGTDASTLVVSDTVSAGGAGDYTITKVSASGTITPESLTITATSDSKTYDGGTTSSQTPTVTTGTIYNGEVAFGQAFASKDALGAGNSVLVVSDTVSAGGAGDYTITKVSASGTITPATLTITAVANTKSYDGNTSAASIPTYAVAGEPANTLYGTDTLTNLHETYDNQFVGTGKTMSVSSDTVNDGNGGHNYNVVTVTNTHGKIDPATLTITSVTHPSTLEGVQITGAPVATFTDGNPSAEPGDYSVTITWADGTVDTTSGHVAYFNGTDNSAGFVVTGSHLYNDEITDATNFTVALVNNADTATASDTINSATVGDNPPTVDLSGNATSTNEGSVYTLHIGAISDPGPNAISEYDINWGDGSDSDFTGTITSLANVNYPHTYLDGPATEFVSVTVVDEDGVHDPSLTPTNNMTVTVNNVPPTATLQNFNPTVNAGSSALVKLINPHDPSGPDTSAGFHYAYDFGDGNWDLGNISYAGSPSAPAVTSSSATIPASYLSTPGVHHIRLAIIDKDNGVTIYPTTITVNDVAPTISLPASTTIGINSQLTQSGSYTSPVTGVTYTATVDYDFTGLAGSHSAVPLTLNANGTFSLSHVYSQATAPSTPFDVRVTITDGTKTTTADESVTVQDSALTVLGVTPTDRGLDIQFNRAIDISQVRLYDGEYIDINGVHTGSHASDMTVTGPGGVQIRGSVVWDSSSDVLHFVRTSYFDTGTGLWTRDTAPLASGNYTVALTGSDWVALGQPSNLLGNFSQTVAVATTTKISLSLPDVARGPGQSIATVANGTDSAGAVGLPIALNYNGQSTTVTAVDFTLTYNASLLTVTGVSVDSALAALGWSATFNSSVAGTLTVALSTTGSALPASSVVNLVNVLGSVPTTSGIYGASGLLKISGVRINEVVGSGAGDSAVEKAVYFGDATGFGSIPDGLGGYTLSGLDATYISRADVGLDSGFHADSLTDPIIAGDVTGDGTLSALDATYVAEEAVGLNVSQIPAPLAPPATFAGVDPQVSIPTTYIGVRGQNVDTVVSINDASGLLAADLNISYNTNGHLVDLTNGDVTLDSYLQSKGWGIAINVNNSTGLARISAYSSSGALTDAAVEPLLHLLFQVPSNDPAGFTNLNIAGRLNEGQETMTTSNGMITIPIITSIDNADNITYGTTEDLSSTNTFEVGSIASYQWTVTKGSSTYLTGTDPTLDFTPTAGSYSVTLVVTDTSGNQGTDTRMFTVGQATPNINWSAPADITYGTALSSTQLNAVSSWTVAGVLGSVAGNFVYTPAAGTLLHAGLNQLLSVTFTPTDTLDYTGASQTTHINVNKFAFSYTIGNDSHVYGSTDNLATDLGTTIATGVNSQNLGIAYSSVGNTTTAHVIGSPYAITGVVSDGSGMSSDYTVTLTNGQLTVTPFAFSYTIGNDTHVYGSTDNLATDLGTTIATGVNSQNLGIAYSSVGNTTTAHVIGSPYDITGVVSDGSGMSSDYTVTLTNGQLSVTPFAFSYTIGNDTHVYGSTDNLATDLGTSIATGVNSQNLGIAYSSVGNTTTAHVIGSPYVITGVLSNGTGTLSDYSVTLTNGQLSVTPYAFSYTIANDTQTYGYPVNLATDLGTTISTGVNSENLGIAYSSTGNTASAPVGPYAITGTLSNGTGSLSDYSPTLAPGTLNVVHFAITSETANASGVDIQFNAPVNASTLRLYDGQTTSTHLIDLTVMNGSAPVNGSLVFSSDFKSASWEATGGVLSAGTFNLNFINGMSDGWNDSVEPLSTVVSPFSSFTETSSTAPVVSVPDFARGPGQAVDVAVPHWANPLAVDNGILGTTGLPVTINSGSTAVTSVNFVLSYNPNVLNVTGAILDSSITGWTMSTPTIDAVHGTITLSASTTGAGLTNVNTLFEIQATVLSTATYGQGEVLKFTTATLNGSINAVADEAINKVAFVGDATGDGSYSSMDASLIARTVVGLDSGFDAYSLADPTIVGDVTGDGTLSGLDAGYVAAYVVGGTSNISAIPSGYVATQASPTIDPAVTVGAVSTYAGGTVNIPVTIGATSGFQAADFTFTYNPALITLSSTDITLGAIPAGWSYQTNVGNGLVRVSMYNTDPLSANSGTLLNMNAHVSNTATSGTVTPVAIAAGPTPSRLNEGQLTMSATNGSVTIVTPTVDHEYTFYYGSTKFDTSPGTPSSDYAAIATDKSALLPGGTASFANYTSYVNGLNGIWVDFANLPSGTILHASDFQFHVGNNNTTSGWATGPAPTNVIMGIDPHTGEVAADIIWATSAPTNEWLQVTVLADSNTHLGSNFVFYYGNAIGETGNSTTDAQVNASDVSATQANYTNLSAALITNHYDINRDGKVNATDVSLIQSHYSNLTPLKLITVPGAAPGAIIAQPLTLVSTTATPTAVVPTALTTAVTTAVPTLTSSTATATSVVKSSGISSGSVQIVNTPKTTKAPAKSAPTSTVSVLKSGAKANVTTKAASTVSLPTTVSSLFSNKKIG